jgi:hypothetical protein
MDRRSEKMLERSQTERTGDGGGGGDGGGARDWSSKAEMRLQQTGGGSLGYGRRGWRTVDGIAGKGVVKRRPIAPPAVSSSLLAAKRHGQATGGLHHPGRLDWDAKSKAPLSANPLRNDAETAMMQRKLFGRRGVQRCPWSSSRLRRARRRPNAAG